jgi:ABC-type Fe3+-hydroxamate transport system substrate-binding protein
VIVSSIGLRRSLFALAAVALLAVLAGCGSDSSGESSTSGTAGAVSVSIPSPTSPVPTATTVSTPTEGTKKKPQTTTSTGGSAPCTVPDAYQDFKYTGLACAAAVAVAAAWDQDGKDCNTVDNPDVEAGYHRTCSVEGFTCTAKRDVHSDGRFVTCTQGGQSVRFTWLPA